MEKGSGKIFTFEVSAPYLQGILSPASIALSSREQETQQQQLSKASCYM